MNSPNSTVRVLKLRTTLEFETILKNSMGEEIAGIWFVAQPDGEKNLTCLRK